jgi:hypothetical protein
VLELARLSHLVSEPESELSYHDIFIEIIHICGFSAGSAKAAKCTLASALLSKGIVSMAKPRTRNQSAKGVSLCCHDSLRDGN